MDIKHYSQVASTYVLALAAGEKGACHGTVFWADTQTEGKGQHDREFISPPGGLYCSILLRPHIPIERFSLITLAAGVACCHIVEQCADIKPRIKWPNDIYVVDKKLAGILSESRTCTQSLSNGHFVVVGIGINVNSISTDLPESVRSGITTLYEQTGACISIKELVTPLVTELDTTVQLLHDTPELVLAEWRKYDYLKNKALACSTAASTLYGIGKGLAADGRYVIVDNTGAEHRILAGTVRCS